jgi:hypothetical protein
MEFSLGNMNLMLKSPLPICVAAKRVDIPLKDPKFGLYNSFQSLFET